MIACCGVEPFAQDVTLLVRGDRRGLANQTYDMARHLRPARILCIEMHPKLSPYPEDWRPYETLGYEPGSTMMMAEAFAPLSAEQEAFLFAGEAIVAAETLYWWDLICARRDVASIVQANLEFSPWVTNPEHVRPTCVALASSWNRERVPWAVVLPAPVCLERFPQLPKHDPDHLLHPVGHRTSSDRNGTLVVQRAAAMMPARATLTIREQAPERQRQRPQPAEYRASGGAIVRHLRADVDRAEELYGNAGALILPRRFGGQSLPVNEAQALGMPVVMTDCAPNREFCHPEALVRSLGSKPLKTQGGVIDVHEPDPRHLAELCTRLVEDPAWWMKLQDHSIERAKRVSWGELGGVWHELVADAAAGVSRGASPL